MSNYLNNLPPQFAEIRRRILEAEAKGLIAIPEIQLDVPEGETPAETVARMERMAGFAMTPVDPAKIREILGMPEHATFDEFPNEQRTLTRLLAPESE